MVEPVKQLEEVLKTIQEIAERYEQTLSPEELEGLAAELALNTYYLRELKVQFHDEWLSAYHSAEGSNAAREREADIVVPQLYHCREVLQGVKGLSISMQNQLK